MKTVSIIIILILIVVFFIIALVFYNGEIRKSDNYFEIQDSLIVKKTDRLIENLDIKNGFKNLFLGTSFEKYNFNSKDWNISKSYDYSVITCSKEFNDYLYINRVQLEKVKLIFFKKKLISISVYGRMSKEKQNITRLLTTLTNLYGEPNQSIPLDFYGNEEWEYIYKPRIRKPTLTNSKKYSLEPIISYKDNKTGIYFRIISHNIIDYYWQSDSIYLEYVNKCVVKQYDPDLKPGGAIGSNNNYVFHESTEYFIISQKYGITQYYIFLDNERKKEKQIEMENKQKAIDKESNKL